MSIGMCSCPKRWWRRYQRTISTLLKAPWNSYGTRNGETSELLKYLHLNILHRISRSVDRCSQSLGWEHYEVHEPEPHILLFKCVRSNVLTYRVLTSSRRPIDYQPPVIVHWSTHSTIPSLQHPRQDGPCFLAYDITEQRVMSHLQGGAV